MYIAVTKRDFSFRMLLGFPVLYKTGFEYSSFNVAKDDNPKPSTLIIYPHKNDYYMSVEAPDIKQEELDNHKMINAVTSLIKGYSIF